MPKSTGHSSGTERRLAAIMFTDIVGYTALMAESEEVGLRARERHRHAVRPLVERYGGEWVEETGDESLSIFPSAVAALNCALAVQAELCEDPGLRLRIGIHLGEILVEGNRIYGDGVNVASRIRPLAEPGGICISDEVQHSVQNQPNFDLASLGEREFKHVARGVEVFAVSGEPRPPDPRPRLVRTVSIGSALAMLAAAMLLLGTLGWYGLFFGASTPELISGFSAPAIAVLPFANPGVDARQDLFAEGLADDLTMRLASWRRFPVIARRSTFEVVKRSESESIDLAQAGRDLGARYVVDGSVRRSRDRVRVSVQLIDATTGRHVWAEQYDRDLGDILVLQDEMTTSIVAAMRPSLLQFESARAMREDPRDLGAWSSALRGAWHFNQDTRDDNARSRSYFEHAIELDPLWGWPYAGLALAHFKDAANGWADSQDQSIASLIAAAQRAVELDDMDASAHHALGHAYAMGSQPGKMISAFQRGAELNPSDATASKCLGAHLALRGRSEEAIEHLDRAISISPRDPELYGFFVAVSWAHFAARRYKAAVDWAEKSIQHRPNTQAYQVAAASLAHLGRRDRARASLGELLRQQPDLSVQGLEQFFSAAEPDFRERLIDGLKKAGWEAIAPRRKSGPRLRM